MTPPNHQEPPPGGPTPGKRTRETILLVLVGVFGIAGIAILQLSRNSTAPARDDDDRSMVQTNPVNTATRPDTESTVLQKIPGNLIRENEQPEAGRPFLFEMSNFSQGAEYALDLGDGSRKSFNDKGLLRHTYDRPGRYQVTLYARYEGQEVRLQSVVKQVAQPVQEEKAITPVIDF